MSKSDINSAFDAIYEALENAGLAPKEIDDGQIAVNVGNNIVKLNIDYDG